MKIAIQASELAKAIKRACAEHDLDESDQIADLLAELADTEENEA